MAVTDVQQRDRPEATFELGKYSIRVPYRVTTDSVNDGPLTVCQASGLPSFYAPYVWGNDSNEDAVLVRYEPKPLGTAPTKVWIVECVYETPTQKESKGSDNANRKTGGGTGRTTPGEFTNPLLEMPSVKWHSSGREALLTRIYDTITGTLKPCTASNGEVFDPPPKYIESLATLEITRNEPIGANQPSIAATYTNAVNSDTFWGVAAGYWKIKEIVPERQDRQVPNSPFKFPFLRVSYSFEYNPQGWDIQLLDYGSYYWERNFADPGGVGNPVLRATRTRIVTTDGHPTSAPLNGVGRPLPDRQPCTITDGSDTIDIPAATPLYPFAVGDTVIFSAIQKPAENGIVAAAPLVFGVPYYVVSNTVTGSAQALKVSLTSGGAAITISNPSNQKGWQYIYSPGVFFPIRPYTRLPFSSLALPQSFAMVQ